MGSINVKATSLVFDCNNDSVVFCFDEKINDSEEIRSKCYRFSSDSLSFATAVSEFVNNIQYSKYCFVLKTGHEFTVMIEREKIEEIKKEETFNTLDNKFKL